MFAAGARLQAPVPQRPRGGGAGSCATVAIIGMALVVGFVVLTGLAALMASESQTAGPGTPVSSTPSKPGASPTDPDPTPTDPDPTPSPTPTPKPKPKPVKPVPDRSWDQLPKPHSSDPVWVALQQNRLYGYDIAPATCPVSSAPFASAAQFQTFMTHYLNCQHNSWTPAFKAMGKPLPKPKLFFFDERAIMQTPCGTIKNYRSSFYCGSPDVGSYGIYIHYDVMHTTNQRWRLRATFTMTHEYVHHVQGMAGIISNGYRLSNSMPTLEISRRIELQDTCITMRKMLVTPAVGFTRRDYDYVVRWFAQDLGPTHGNGESHTYWGLRGFYMPKVGGCNTWTVGSSRVR